MNWNTVGAKAVQMQKCYICDDNEGEVSSRCVKGDDVYICDDCAVCECCEDPMDDIDESNWITVKRYEFPQGGWIFIPVENYNNYLVEDIALQCNYCQSMQCEACRGFCMNPCATCDGVCSGCSCSVQKEKED